MYSVMYEVSSLYQLSNNSGMETGFIYIQAINGSLTRSNRLGSRFLEGTSVYKLYVTRVLIYTFLT